MPLASVDPSRAATPSETALTRRVDLTTLRLFIAICDEQNLTRAAQREGIAASAVSKRMNDFELAFGVTLFKRLAKGMALTPAGEALLHQARVTLLNVEKIAAEIGICSGEADSRALEAFPYRTDNLVVVMRSDHPLAGSERLAFTETLDFDHIGLHTASSIYLRSQYAATQAGKAMRLRINVPGFDAVCRMVQANMGLGLIPDRAFEVVGAGMGLAAIPLRDEWGRRELKIVVRDAVHLSATGRLMLDHLRAIETDLRRGGM